MEEEDFEALKQIQKLNKLKATHDCLCLEVVVPIGLEKKAQAYISGMGGTNEEIILIEFALQILGELMNENPALEEYFNSSKYNEG